MPIRPSSVVINFSFKMSISQKLPDSDQILQIKIAIVFWCHERATFYWPILKQTFIGVVISSIGLEQENASSMGECGHL